MAPASAAMSAASRQSGCRATARNASQPASQALPVPIAEDSREAADHDVGREHRRRDQERGGDTPKARFTAAHIPPTARARKANAIQRVPATPMTAERRSGEHAQYPCQ